MKRIGHQDLIWGYSAQLLNVGTGILLLPVILHFMSPADVGLWIVFVTLGSLSQLLEFGFQPTIARNVAYIYGGATNLNKEGLSDRNDQISGINLTLLSDLIAASRRIYRLIAVVAGVLLLTAGTFYISTLITSEQHYYKTLLGWCAFAVGYVLFFYFGYINGLLQGRGDVTQANKVVVSQRSIFLVLGAVFTAAGGGLLGLGVASMIAALMGRIIALSYFKMKNEVVLSSSPISESCSETITKTLWHNASRLGTVQLGAFLINRASILIASSALGVSQAASYSLTLTILLTLASSASVVAQINLPRMSSLQVQKDRGQLIQTYRSIVMISSFTFVLGFILFFVIATPALVIIGSSVSLLSPAETVLLGIILLLEVHHSNAATVLTTTNQIPFVPAALLSGIAIVSLSLVLVKPFGVLGLVVSQGVVQLLYNNWKWPVEVLSSIQASYADIYKFTYEK